MKRLHTTRIAELADSNEPAITFSFSTSHHIYFCEKFPTWKNITLSIQICDIEVFPEDVCDIEGPDLLVHDSVGKRIVSASKHGWADKPLVRDNYLGKTT